MTVRGRQLGKDFNHQHAETPLPPASLGAAERDVVALGIAVAAILLFIGNGGQALSAAYAAAAGFGLGPNLLLTNTLLLNIALVIFGWRRYADLSHEVDQRRQAEAYARLLAETDPLTGCLNRRSIGPATDELISQARQRGESVAFMMIDLDNFKQVNDCHGHAAGDALLLESARRIQAVVPPRSLVARLGGDEFACVITFDPRYPERVDQLAAAVINGVSTPFEFGEFTGQVTVSAGLTRSDRETRFADAETGSTAAALLHMADIAMYQAKKAGRNRYTWFEDTMESELRYRSELERGIREGIGKGEFVTLLGSSGCGTWVIGPGVVRPGDHGGVDQRIDELHQHQAGEVDIERQQRCPMREQQALHHRARYDSATLPSPSSESGG